MSSYDFSGLSPSEFEALCCDLLGHFLGVKLQSFTTGRDNGIDLRHAPSKNKTWIIQCKHFSKSGFSKLKSHLKNKEIPKIKNLQPTPTRYILATSVGLSPGNVDELFEMLTPFCLSKHDIIGRDDLNSILREVPKVEQSHFKLWLTSEAVLNRVLQNDVFVQSWITQEEIRHRLNLYVYTNSFERARKKLAKDHVCILSGVPGVGKTTLAEMLLVDYLAKDWQLVSINQNVNEALKVFQSNAKANQVFYYDDFLGQVAKGDKLGKNEDRSLLQLVGAIARNRNKRFILTTREYILAQAKSEHEQLSRSKIDLFKFVVKCEDYSEFDKARILANHLYFSNVPQGHISELIKSQSYKMIISHRNYNPRVVEWMTHETETDSCTAKKYPSVFLSRLENPSELWLHAFENQISEASRHVLLVLATCGDGVLTTNLEQAFHSFFSARSLKYRFDSSPSSFSKALNELEGNFIRIERSDSRLVVTFHNPSIIDFLNDWISAHSEDINELLSSAIFFEQVERLFMLSKNVSSRSKKITAFTPDLVIKAIDRSLQGEGCQMQRHGIHWYRKGRRIWERLKVCCNIASQIDNRELHRTVERHVDTQMRDLDSQNGQIEEIVVLFNNINRSGWCSEKMRERWRKKMLETLLLMEPHFYETLEGYSAAAKWYDQNKYYVDSDQNKEFLKNFEDAVRTEIQDNSDTSDYDRLSWDLVSLQDISKSLGIDFEKEEKWFSEKMTECESANSGNVVEQSDSPRQLDASSIDSLFQALII